MKKGILLAAALSAVCLVAIDTASARGRGGRGGGHMGGHSAGHSFHGGGPRFVGRSYGYSNFVQRGYVYELGVRPRARCTPYSMYWPDCRYRW